MDKASANVESAKDKHREHYIFDTNIMELTLGKSNFQELTQVRLKNVLQHLQMSIMRSLCCPRQSFKQLNMRKSTKTYAINAPTTLGPAFWTASVNQGNHLPLTRRAAQQICNQMTPKELLQQTDYRNSVCSSSKKYSHLM